MGLRCVDDLGYVLRRHYDDLGLRRDLGWGLLVDHLRRVDHDLVLMGLLVHHSDLGLDLRLRLWLNVYLNRLRLLDLRLVNLNLLGLLHLMNLMDLTMGLLMMMNMMVLADMMSLMMYMMGLMSLLVMMRLMLMLYDMLGANLFLP